MGINKILASRRRSHNMIITTERYRDQLLLIGARIINLFATTVRISPLNEMSYQKCTHAPASLLLTPQRVVLTMFFFERERTSL